MKEKKKRGSGRDAGKYLRAKCLGEFSVVGAPIIDRHVRISEHDTVWELQAMEDHRMVCDAEV